MNQQNSSLIESSKLETLMATGKVEGRSLEWLHAAQDRGELKSLTYQGNGSGSHGPRQSEEVK